MKTASIEEVADGVFAAIAAEGGVAVGNAGFVDLGGEALVFDAHLTLFAGRELQTAAEQHGLVHNVVLGHWHGDHVYGAGRVRRDRCRNGADPNPFTELAFPEMWERNVTALADRAA